MIENKEYINNRTKFVVSGIAFTFCLIWALIGESDIKLIAVSITFMCFLKNGIAMEESAIAAGGSH